MVMVRATERSLRDSRQLRWDDLVAYPRPGLGTIAWRWRTEITLVTAAAVGWFVLHRRIGLPGTITVALVTVIVAVALPWTRRRVRCVVTRHRLYTVLREIRATTRSGRIPLVLRVTPWSRGERVVLWCRAGVSARQMHDHADQIAAACWAGQAAVHRHHRWTQVVVIHITRYGV